MTREQQDKCIKILNNCSMPLEDVYYIINAIMSVHCDGKQEKIKYRIIDTHNNEKVVFIGTRKEVIEKFGKDPNCYYYSKSYINRRYRVEK